MKTLPRNFNDRTVKNNYMIDLIPENKFDTILYEFFRVLKPGGRLVMATFSFGNRYVHRFWYFLAKLFPGLLAGCRPVSIRGNLEKMGFRISRDLLVSQNTFPTEIIRAEKPLLNKTL